MNTEQIRRQEKIIYIPGTSEPTVPTVANHTLPGWLETDIYKGELAFVRWGNKYKVFSRDEFGIFEIVRMDDFMVLYDGINLSLTQVVDLLLAEIATREQNETFVFTQMDPSAEWIINHNLGRKPSVTVIDSAGDECEGQITFTDNNSLTITFSSAFGGEAYLN